MKQPKMPKRKTEANLKSYLERLKIWKARKDKKDAPKKAKKARIDSLLSQARKLRGLS